MRARERRRLRREVRGDLFQLRRDNPELGRKAFQNLAEQQLARDFDGIDPDTWKLILQIIKELLPLIMLLF